MTTTTFDSLASLIGAGLLLQADPVVQAIGTSAAGDGGPAYVVISDTRTGETHRIWTDGAGPLGDTIDATAMLADWHGLDYLALCERHFIKQDRGQLVIRVYPLRAIGADVDGDRHATPEEIHGLLTHLGRPDLLPKVARTPWLGFGPLLRNTYEAAR